MKALFSIFYFVSKKKQMISIQKNKENMKRNDSLTLFCSRRVEDNRNETIIKHNIIRKGVQNCIRINNTKRKPGHFEARKK